MKTCKHPDGCPRRVKAYGWCKPHAERIKKHGDPGPVEVAPRLDGNRPCKVDDCHEPVTSAGGYGMCCKHYQRWRKHGDPTVVAKGGASMPGESNPNWSEDASYNAVHIRLRHLRGNARAHACVDCERTAAHWSYDNSDPDERTDPTAGRYSVDPAHYSPRCVPCHSAFDRRARVALLTGERPA